MSLAHKRTQKVQLRDSATSGRQTTDPVSLVRLSKHESLACLTLGLWEGRTAGLFSVCRALNVSNSPERVFSELVVEEQVQADNRMEHSTQAREGVCLWGPEGGLCYQRRTT